MKKLLLISTVFLGLTVAQGQTNVYQPFPTDSALWLYGYQTSPSNTIYTVIEWLGDTVINLKTYKKEYRNSSPNPYLANTNLQYAGGIRQDIPNEKIYLINLSGVETDASINQHLIIGDTCPLHSSPVHPYFILSIDSIQIGNKFHKRYHSQDSSGIGTESYIVGVGEESDLFPEGGNGLGCYSVNNVLLIGSSMNPYCPHLVSTNDMGQIKNKIKFSPNPFSSTTTLQADNPFHNATLTLYNLYGQQIKQIKNISGQVITLFRDNLPSGLYFLHLTQDNKVVTNDKLIITDN